MNSGLLRAVDAVTVRVPDLDAGLAFLPRGAWPSAQLAQQRPRPGRSPDTRQLDRDEPFETPVGRVAVVGDPFGTTLVLVDLSKGRYEVDPDGRVTGVG